MRDEKIKESKIRDKWATKLNGRTEIRMPNGYADIVTATHIFEVKPYKGFKHALGQALYYAYHLKLTPGIILYKCPPCIIPQIDICNSYGVTLITDKDHPLVRY